jgi:hypothetical protein
VTGEAEVTPVGGPLPMLTTTVPRYVGCGSYVAALRKIATIA